MDSKQELANLIDAYADARRTGNEILIKLSVEQLQAFLVQYDLIPLGGGTDEQVQDTEGAGVAG
jgi:hypothetical protein